MYNVYTSKKKKGKKRLTITVIADAQWSLLKKFATGGLCQLQAQNFLNIYLFLPEMRSLI